ncbi:hypothetical protein K1W54_06420, partial [Micromonospora sp. CPCC 205371]|nr:hypothetical protein [Micromonospora sp. CPCC 205371]
MTGWPPLAASSHHGSSCPAVSGTASPAASTKCRSSVSATPDSSIGTRSHQGSAATASAQPANASRTVFPGSLGRAALKAAAPTPSLAEPPGSLGRAAPWGGGLPAA